MARVCVMGIMSRVFPCSAKGGGGGKCLAELPCYTVLERSPRNWVFNQERFQHPTSRGVRISTGKWHGPRPRTERMFPIIRINRPGVRSIPNPILVFYPLVIKGSGKASTNLSPLPSSLYTPSLSLSIFLRFLSSNGTEKRYRRNLHNMCWRWPRHVLCPKQAVAF